MDTFVLHVFAFDAETCLRLEVFQELLIDEIEDRFPTEDGKSEENRPCSILSLPTDHSEEFIASPKPGVSTTVKRSFTPFSSNSTVRLSISTVFGG